MIRPISTTTNYNKIAFKSIKYEWGTFNEESSPHADKIVDKLGNIVKYRDFLLVGCRNNTVDLYEYTDEKTFWGNRAKKHVGNYGNHNRFSIDDLPPGFIPPPEPPAYIPFSLKHYAIAGSVLLALGIIYCINNVKFYQQCDDKIINLSFKEWVNKIDSVVTEKIDKHFHKNF